MTLSPSYIKCMDYTKRNKRCIPKEGMPHAHKVCQKKEEEKRWIPKEGMPHASKAWQKEKENIAHTKNFTRREKSYEGVPPSSTKNIHTLAHVDQGLWLVSPLDPVFDSAKYEKQVCLHILHTYSSTEKKPLWVGRKRKAHKKSLVRNGHFWVIREITRGTYQILFKNFIKPPDWWLSKGVGK